MLFNLLFIILGLTFGSFISALSYRIIRGVSITSGRSYCDSCKKNLGWMENIPVISYIFLGGICKNCRKKISLRYPLIELSCGIGFFLIYFYRTALPYNFIFCLAIFVLLVLIFVTDIEHQIIPDEFIFAGVFLSILYFSLFTSHYSLFPNLFYGFFSASLLMLVNIITKGRGMGLGDVKFAVLGGLLMGPTLSLLWLLLSFLTGAIASIILILAGGAKLKDKIAFGPFLVISIGLTYLVGDNLLNIIFR